MRFSAGMLRKLFAGHRIECRPFVEPDGTRGYHFRAEVTYAALLGTGVATDGRVPDGIQTRYETTPTGGQVIVGRIRLIDGRLVGEPPDAWAVRMILGRALVRATPAKPRQSRGIPLHHVGGPEWV